MKHLLRLIGALALTTCAATSVVACGGNPTVAFDLDTEIAAALGLVTKEGQGTEQVTINDKQNWEIPAAKTPITADKLLNDKKAKNEDAYKFITETLGIEPEKEGTWQEAEFKVDELAAITATITDISPNLEVAENKVDYAVVGGNFKLQFTKNDGKETVGSKYSLPLKIDLKEGVFASVISKLAEDITVADTDAGTSIIKFKTNEICPEEALDKIDDGIAINLVGESTAVKKLQAVTNLLPAKLNIQTSAYEMKDKGSGNRWAADDTLTISYSSGSVTFAGKTKLELV